jgi:predicted Zn-dependent peptidase
MSRALRRWFAAVPAAAAPVLTLAALLAAPAAVPRAAWGQERVVVRTEAGTPVVAMEVLVATGPADEPAEQAGITYLTARGVTAPVAAVLDSLGARLAIDVHKDAVSFTVIAAPDVWRDASRALLGSLFRDPVDSVATMAQRAEIVAELAAREASPADELVRSVDAALYGADHPWGRPAVGTAATVGRLTVAEVDNHLRRHFTADRALVTAVGPVEEESVAAHLRLFIDPGRLRRSPVEPGVPARAPVLVQLNAITAWVAAVYPFDADADVEALRMLAEMAVERVSFGPLRPSVYDARAEVVRHGVGGEVRLHVVVPPREAEAWANRLNGAVREYAQRAMPEEVFAERLRRFRGERLLALAAPEDRARALARVALLGGPADPIGDLAALTPERIHAAARGLGRPVVVVLGPFVDEEGED